MATPLSFQDSRAQPPPFFYNRTQTMATLPSVDFSVNVSGLKRPNNMFMVSEFHVNALKTKYMNGWSFFNQWMKKPINPNMLCGSSPFQLPTSILAVKSKPCVCTFNSFFLSLILVRQLTSISSCQNETSFCVCSSFFVALSHLCFQEMHVIFLRLNKLLDWMIQ